MKQTVFPAGALLCVASVLLTCGVDPLTLNRVTGAPHAFVRGGAAIDISRLDTNSFSTCDTVHPGDSLTFWGVVNPPDNRVEGVQWSFGDGLRDPRPVVKHVYGKDGIYTAVFSIHDSVGNSLCDSVHVCVNTPPDSIRAVSPADGAVRQPLTIRLEWKGYDRDDFDSALAYTVVVIPENKGADTLVLWKNSTAITLKGFENSQRVAWFALARDKFGEVTASDTFHFTTIGSSDATLARLRLSVGRLVSAISQHDTVYCDTVGDTVSDVTITAVAKDKHATVAINQTELKPTDSSASVSLSQATTYIAIKVAAADGTTTATYPIYVTRLPNPNSLLCSLIVSSGKLAPAVNPLADSLLDTVSSSTVSITLTPFARDTLTAIVVGSESVKSGRPCAAIPLTIGKTVIVSVKVTSADGKTKKTYVVSLFRKPYSAVSLSSLLISKGTLTQQSVPIPDTLRDTVSFKDSSVVVTPVATDTQASITVNSAAVKSNAASLPVQLAVGINKINIKVAAPDGTLPKTYTLLIIRQAISLFSVLVSKGTLTQQSAPVPDTLRDTVSFKDSSVVVTPIMTDTQALITVNLAAVKSNTASLPIPLAVGINKIIIRIAAPDGSFPRAYILLAIRKPNNFH